MALGNWIETHLRNYLESNGAVGYIIDNSACGGNAQTTCLVLKTIGRRSGRALLTPLIYSKSGDEYVIVASNGGAPNHPAWFLNLTAQPAFDFQVADRRFRGTWRIAQAQERQFLWRRMVDYYPPYTDCQERTAREIPIILIQAAGSIAAL